MGPMPFAYPLPWWLALVLAAAIGAVPFVAYRRPLAPLTRSRRAILIACRAMTLMVVVLFLFRPIVLVPPGGGNGAVVPVLVDVSRSMRLNDAGGQTRLARPVPCLQTTLIPGPVPAVPAPTSTRAGERPRAPPPLQSESAGRPAAPRDL